MINEELNEQGHALLESALAKLVIAAEQVGLSTQDLLDMLNGGMTTLQIVDYLHARAAGHDHGN